jgi:hypothetical protein
VNFFRSIGGSLGVALVGALFASRLAGGGDEALRPDQVRDLPAGVEQDYVVRFADALTGTFWYVVPLLVTGFALALLLRERPLRDSVHAEPVPLEL